MFSFAAIKINEKLNFKTPSEVIILYLKRREFYSVT